MNYKRVFSPILLQLQLNSYKFDSAFHSAFFFYSNFIDQGLEVSVDALNLFLLTELSDSFVLLNEPCSPVMLYMQKNLKKNGPANDDLPL